MLIRLLTITLLTATIALAQNGDKANETQTPRVPKEKIPPAPPLAPAEALKSFKLPPGLKMQLVASEPMIDTPIVVQWDADGRLWVVEMRAYMPNPAAEGEDEPLCQISVLEDTDGDGVMDKKTVFLDKQVLPRALAFAHGGVLVCEPPSLWFYPIESGLKPGPRVLVAKDYATAGDPKLGTKKNPEHTANSLYWGLDNFIYSANSTVKFRRVDEEWKRYPTTFRGQWGFAQDDFGRPFYNSNSDQLRCDLVPSEYYFRNPLYRANAGLNIAPLGKDQSVWPARVNPGVNRGYQEKQLRPDGTLATFTAVCGPTVYRGDLLPKDFLGSAFVCEPAGNLVRRIVLDEHDGTITGENPYKQTEFLTSQDELFRPINSYTGPDGALYIVDMYRGIIQHRVFLTSYLRKQAEDRGIDKLKGYGRIWRVVPEGKPTGPRPQLGSAKPAELVAALSHPNGWWRSTAQRLLVEKASSSAVAPLKELAVAGAAPLGRLHALWTLEGMGQLDATTLATVLDKESHTKVRAAAIRLSEPFLKTADKEKLLPKLLAQMAVKHLDVQQQLAFTLGQVIDPQAEAAMAGIARNGGTNAIIREALVSGLMGRELEMLDRVIRDPNWKASKPGNDAFISALSKNLFTQARGERVNKLLAHLSAPETAPWQTIAVLGSISLPTPAAKGQPTMRVKLVKLAAEPPALALLEKSDNKSIREGAQKLDKLIVWPGKPGVIPEPPLQPLTEAQQKAYAAGKAAFEASCAACHQPHGLGQEGLAPPLVDSEWVAGNPERIARIVLHGVSGALNVQGRKWDLDMPALGTTFDDATIAGILTYIRREWEHPYDPVDAALVKKVRAANAQRDSAWTQEELLKVK